MTVDVRGIKPLPPADTSVKTMLAAFRRGSSLVDAALVALADLAPALDALQAGLNQALGSSIAPQVNHDVLALGRLLDSASAEGDNLLLTPRGRAAGQPLVVFTLARKASGAVSVQSIEIDRAAIALSDGVRRDSALAYDRLFKASRDFVDSGGTVSAVQTALTGLRTQRVMAASRLSIAKARFDLQSSFLNAVAQAGAAAPVVQLESHLSGIGARDMAYETRLLLSRQSLNIANGNRDTLRDLLRTHAAKLKS